MKRIILTMTLLMLAGAPGVRLAPTAAPPQGVPENNALLAITGGTLLDVETGTPLRDSLILIEGDRLKQLGQTGKVAVPAQAKVIDARGKWIIPGLADMHAHLSTYEYRLPEIYLKYGVTTLRDVAGDVTLLRLLREEIKAGKRAGPRVFFTGMLLDGAPPVHRSSLTLLADTPARAESIVNFLADQGVDAIKVYNLISEATLAKVIETARGRHLLVIGHVPRAMTMTRAVEMGMDCLEHIRITAREILPAEEAKEIDYLPVGVREPKLWSRIDLQSNEIKNIIALLARKQVYLDPTLTADEALYVDGMQAMRTHPNNRLLPQAILDRLLRQREAAIFALPDEMKSLAAESFKKRQQFIGMCHRAGVRLLAGTDAFGLGKMIPGLSLHHELELLVEAGLAPLDALRAATITAARALRKESDLGSIKAGKLADLVFLDADPLANINNTQKIHGVMKGGRIYDPAAPIGETK
jgi:imidazolonepropionase-like amidohydrolase